MRHYFSFSSLFLLLYLCLFVSVLHAQDEKKYQLAVVGFYNIENLFDTVDDPEKWDEQFLPDGDYVWTGERYLNKLERLSEVVDQIGKDFTPDGAAILGLSEIENKDVIVDLIHTPLLKKQDFDVVHYDSPDRRGVDVGLIYKKKYFMVTNSASYRLTIPGKDDFYSRDQLVVSGKLLGDDVHIIVNHWPSRRGGEKASRPLRNAAAELSRHICDSLLNTDAQARIIVMGDLNDNPNNESVEDIMRAKGDSTKLKEGDFYNPMFKMYKQGIGSNAWRDTWSLFDQTLVSQGLLGADYSGLKLYRTVIFNKGFLKQKDGRYKGYPYRTYAAGVWDGGYSDHFPVFVLLVKEAN